MSQAIRDVRGRGVLVLIAAVVSAIALLGILSGFYVDLLWFREVRYSSVFWSMFWSKVLLGLVFGAIFFLLLFVNLSIVRRLRPRQRVFSMEREVLDRYRVAFEPYSGPILFLFSAVVSLFVGVAAATHWQDFLLWRSAGGEAFGIPDPQFGRDAGFYVFILPFHKFVQGWLFSALVGVTVISAIAHYFTGGIRTETLGEKVLPQVRGHLSVLIGLIVLVKAWGYYLGRFDLLVSPRGVATGASYTDVHAQLPALKLLTVIAIVCAALFLVNVRYRIWALPVLGIGLLALTSVVAGALVPAAVQRFQVAPQEFEREAGFIERNIRATRYAFGLDRVERNRQEDVPEDVTAREARDNEATIQNIRLWSPAVLRQTYLQLQRIQPYYEFPDVDVDRYEIDGRRRVVMLSPREISQEGIPGGGGTWQNKHLVFTHGYGAVASPVNVVTPEGSPVFVLKDIPPEGNGIRLDAGEGSEIYYGERTDVPYVVVGGANQQELNYPSPTGQRVTTRYQGEGGISLGSLFRRMLFAWRFRDVNLLISGLIDEQSKILINRAVTTRVQKVAPFLRFDADPYTAIVDGRIQYIWDAYTTTDRYPYSEYADLEEATNGLMTGRVNYIRNSVKAVVDAYDGTVRLHVVDRDDPLIRVWRRAFPGLFAAEAPSAELQAHFRYPENLLQVQATQFANYHVTDPRTFYTKEEFWAVPRALVDRPEARAAEGSMEPYYVLMKLPEAELEQFVLFMPFTPFERLNMVAYMAGVSDPGEDYGRLAVYEFPGGENVDGPQQVRARVVQHPQVSREITLLSQRGSEVVFGDLLIVPIEKSFLYVQPMFVRSTEQAIPELKRVVVVHGGTVTMGDSLEEAISASFGNQPAPPEEDDDAPPADGDVSQLVAEALRHLETANELLRSGDLAGYQREIDLARRLLEQANSLPGDGAAPTPSPVPSPTPTG